MLAGKICEIERRKDENDLVDVFRNCSSCCCDQCESISDRPTADNGGNQGEEVNEPLPDNGGNQGAGMNEPPPDNGGNQGAGMNEPLDNGGNQSAGMNEPPPDNGGNQGAEVNESPPDNGGNQGAEVNEPPPDNGGNQGAGVNEPHPAIEEGNCCKKCYGSVYRCTPLLFPISFLIFFIYAVILGIMCLVLVILSLFIPCVWFITYPMIRNFKNKCCKSCEKSNSCCKNCKLCWSEVKQVLKDFCTILFFGILWFTQRTIISSITFILRLMKYFIFVAMPARLVLFRYFLIFFTALSYIFKYHDELVKMATEVLDEIRSEKKRKTESTNNSQSSNKNCSKQYNFDDVEEETFERIMSKLTYSYRWYAYIIKCLVIIAYIYITVEALQNSETLKSSNHFEEFMYFLFIALSPAIVQRLYKTRHGYLDEKQKMIIKGEVEKIYSLKKTKTT